MKQALNILAGAAALEIIRERGLRREDIDIVAGASGGPKFLAIAGLDRELFPWLAHNTGEKPLHLIGSSIGSWRMACLAMRDPVTAFERLEEVYIEQRYSSKPSPEEVSAVFERMLSDVLGKTGVDEILDNRAMRLHVMTARCQGLIGSESRPVLTAGLAFAAIANLFSRKSLGWQMERVIFDNAGSASPFENLRDLPTQRIALNRQNLLPALAASGSIPLVVSGVNMPDASAGIYRDGGVIDYHPDIDFGDGAGIVLYPHFYSHVIPGWFDKALPWRRADGANLDRVLMLAPSREFVAQLPGGRIPSRKDFYRYDTVGRIRVWREVCKASERLGEEFRELLASGKWLERIRPIRAGEAE